MNKKLILAKLEEIQITISGGLTYFTADAKHAQLKDAERELNGLVSELKKSCR